MELALCDHGFGLRGTLGVALACCWMPGRAPVLGWRRCRHRARSARLADGARLMHQFPTPTVQALTRNGWTLTSQPRARRDYPGGITAIITSDGCWEVVSGSRRLSGHEPTPISAAMEANNRAWEQPEYLRAVRAARTTILAAHPPPRHQKSL
jgi:hypothetical protein